MHRSQRLVTRLHYTRKLSTASIVSSDLLERYNALCTLGNIEWDEGQVRVIMQLRRLTKELQDYEPTQISYIQPVTDDAPHTTADPSLKSLIKAQDLSNEMLELKSPKGLLLTGPPGSGKTFVADTWFASLPTPYKMRKHYSQFILDLYRGVWEVTATRMRTGMVTPTASSQPQGWTKSIREQVRYMLKTADGNDVDTIWDRLRKSTPPSSSLMIVPIPYVLASRLIRSSYVLLLDEVQLQDVSSALLMSDVLIWYWRMGGVVVGTSNRVPEDLYVNGVQKERLGAFGSALRVRCPVVQVGGADAKDYRVVASTELGQKTWFLHKEKNEFRDLACKLLGDSPSSTHLSVFGRQLHIPRVSSDGSVCSFTFDQLCEESLGPADYLSIASAFRTIIITDIPSIRLPSGKNQARRFISLVDALYEARCRIACLANCTLEDLFVQDQAGAIDDTDALFQESVSVSDGGEGYRPNIIAYSESDIREHETQRQRDVPLETLSIFSGKDEQFAFKRAYSRLLEMTSSSYDAKSTWMPLPESLRKWEQAERVVGGGTRSLGDIPSTSQFAPKLSENHVWGVREDWGGGGRWGRGASAYDGDKPKK